VPRFFFNARSGTSFSQDWDGFELPDIEAARRKAGQVAEQFWNDLPPAVSPGAVIVEIIDESGQKPTTVAFSSVPRHLSVETQSC